MTKALAKKEAPYSQEQIDLIKKTVAKDATNDELKLFLIVAARSGLDPFSRQIHFVKRKGQGAFQTGIDVYRAIAERTKTLAIIDDAIFDTETEPHPNKATVTVHRMIGGQRVPFTASARWNEYVPGPGQDMGNVSTVWLWGRRRRSYWFSGRRGIAAAFSRPGKRNIQLCVGVQEMAIRF
jgi:hypothetical protein